MIPPVARRLPDGRRLHLQHGPMDLIVHVGGPRQAVDRAETAAIARFETILDELVPQLSLLRSPLDRDRLPDVQGTVAPRMVAAAATFADVWVTPMVAVAGSVAEEIRDTIAAVDGVTSAYVNNGGDVALHLVAGESLRVGLVADLTTGALDHVLPVAGEDDIRGLATSGAGGRSHSLGVADAVTAIGIRTSVCDAAATVVANAVDLPDHAAVRRIPARELDPDSDLDEQLVTIDVGELSPHDVEAALDAGEREARRRLDAVPDLRGLVLRLRGQRRIVGDTVASRLVQTEEPLRA